MQRTTQFAPLPRTRDKLAKAGTRWFTNLAGSAAWRDYRTALDGLRAMWHYSRALESIDIALSLLSATAPVVHPGRMTTYRVTLVNTGSEPRWLKLIVDIYSAGNPVHPEGHLGYFDKVVMVGARASQDVQIAFDWKECAVFKIEGVEFLADGLWLGPCRTAGVYLVRAIAAGEQGQTLAQLEIHQKLS